MTIKQFASLLSVSEPSAYGLMQFLIELGQVEVTDAPSNGKRGRRPKLYKLSPAADAQLIDLMHKLGNQLVVQAA